MVCKMLNKATVSGSVSGKSIISGKVEPNAVIKGVVEKPESVIVKELNFNNRFEFPSIGKTDMLYIATDENRIYRFDEESITYYCIGSDYNEIEVIQGIL